MIRIWGSSEEALSVQLSCGLAPLAFVPANASHTSATTNFKTKLSQPGHKKV
jgi:hypothetical protein